MSNDNHKDRPETDDKEKKGSGMPSAGPHAQERLTNPDATPGTGSLPPVGESDEPNIQPTS